MGTLFRAIAWIGMLAVINCACGASWHEREQLRNLYAEEPLYTCCNLRPTEGAISDANWYETSSILATPNGALPFGTQVEVIDVGGKSFSVRTAQLGEFTISLEYGNEPLAEYMNKLLLKENPEDLVATFPADVQDAIWEARVIPGDDKRSSVNRDRLPTDTSNTWHGCQRVDLLEQPVAHLQAPVQQTGATVSRVGSFARPVQGRSLG